MPQFAISCFTRKCHIPTIANVVIKLYGMYQPIKTPDPPDRGHSQALSAYKTPPRRGSLQKAQLQTSRQ